MSERPTLSGLDWKPDSDVGKLRVYMDEIETEKTRLRDGLVKAKQRLELVSRPNKIATPWEREAYDGIDGALEDIDAALKATP